MRYEISVHSYFNDFWLKAELHVKMPRDLLRYLNSLMT